MTRWPVPHPLPARWPRRKHYVLVKVSAPKGIGGPQVRRELRTMVNELRYSDGFPGEIRIITTHFVTDISRLGKRYHLKQLQPALLKAQVDGSMRRVKRTAKVRRHRKAKAEAAKDVVPKRRKSPWS
jgi:hypothetical protein